MWCKIKERVSTFCFALRAEEKIDTTTSDFMYCNSGLFIDVLEHIYSY